MGANMTLVRASSNGDKNPGYGKFVLSMPKILGSLVRKAIIKELFRLTCCAYE